MRDIVFVKRTTLRLARSWTKQKKPNFFSQRCALEYLGRRWHFDVPPDNTVLIPMREKYR
jgi:hypothetical protein